MIKTCKIHIRGEDIPVDIRVSGRARRLQFRLDARMGHIILTLPPGISQRQGLEFVESKANWILPRRAKILQNQITLTAGAMIPVDGCLLPLQFGNSPVLGDEEIQVRKEQAQADLARLLKTRAKAVLTPLSHDKADDLGYPIVRLSFRDTKSRWGSCTSNGHISFNWRIICAEPLLQDYLVAHEVAHLKEPHHQPAFWDQCARLMTQPQSLEEARTKLRAIGPKLLALPLAYTQDH